MSDDVKLLVAAVVEGDVVAVQGLLDRGVDVNATAAGLTPLQAACVAGRAGVAELLLDRGADPNFKPAWGDEAARLAAADAGLARWFMMSPVHIAVNDRSLELLELILRRGGELDHAAEQAVKRDETGAVLAVVLRCNRLGAPPELRRLLGDAVQRANWGVVRALIKHGATLPEDSPWWYHRPTRRQLEECGMTGGPTIDWDTCAYRLGPWRREHPLAKWRRDGLPHVAERLPMRDATADELASYRALGFPDWVIEFLGHLAHDNDADFPLFSPRNVVWHNAADAGGSLRRDGFVIFATTFVDHHPMMLLRPSPGELWPTRFFCPHQYHLGRFDLLEPEQRWSAAAALSEPITEHLQLAEEEHEGQVAAQTFDDDEDEDEG